MKEIKKIKNLKLSPVVGEDGIIVHFDNNSFQLYESKCSNCSNKRGQIHFTGWREEKNKYVEIEIGVIYIQQCCKRYEKKCIEEEIENDDILLRIINPDYEILNSEGEKWINYMTYITDKKTIKKLIPIMMISKEDKKRYKMK